MERPCATPRAALVLLVAGVAAALLSPEPGSAREIPQRGEGPANAARVGEFENRGWRAEPERFRQRPRRGEEAPRWTLARDLASPGAAFLKPRWRLALEHGEHALVRDAGGRVIERLTAASGDGAFWGLSVPGDRLRIEITLRRDPARTAARPALRLEGWVVGDRARLEAASGILGAARSLCAPPDFEDAACSEADAAKWANVLATAGVLTASSEGAFLCTGVNVSPRNVVLTAETCLADTAACLDAEFIFGFYRDGCGSLAPVADGWRGYRCLETVASSPFAGTCDPMPPSALDFSLHRVAGDPAGDWGWSDPAAAAPASGERLYIPQHAGGRPLEITHGDGADVVVDGATLRYFGTLDTEGSSVGAPVFRDSDDALVGLHHCGGCASPGVGNRAVLMRDIRPQIEDFLCEPGGDPALEIAGIRGLEPVDGNGDAVLDPGETWRFTPALRNAACGGAAASDLRATFAAAADSAPLELLDTESTLASLDAASTGEGTPIRFRIAARAPCAGRAAIDLVSIASGGGAFPGEPGFFARELGEIPKTALLDEGFDEGVIPAGWTVVDGGTGSGPAATWTAADPGARQLPGAPFAIVDSELLGPGETMDEQLITPTVDASPFANLTLRLRHEFLWFDGNLDEQARIEVRSSATGGLWTEVAGFAGEDAAGALEIDLSPWSASDLQVRFRYFDAEWEGYWAVDDARILGDNGPRCFAGVFADDFESGGLSAWSGAGETAD